MRKRFLSILLTACMVLTLLPGFTQPALAAGEGTGNPANGAFTLNTSGVNIISNADQLAYVAQQVNAGTYGWGNANYKLGNDINLTAYSNWTPIGKYQYEFIGTFDGAGHIISNLRINTTSSEGSSYGLFGEISGGTVKNVGLSGVNISVTSGANSLFVGGLSGNSDGTIRNCFVTGSISGTVTHSSVYFGGLAGRNWEGTIVNCYTNATVSVSGAGSYSVGGLAGFDRKGYISYSYWLSTATAVGIGSGTLTGIGNCSFTSTDALATAVTVGGTNTSSLLAALNAWLNNAARTDLYTWVSSGSYPVFGPLWTPPTYTATVTVNKDGSVWSGSGKSLALYQGTKKYDLPLSGSSATVSALAGTYDIYDGASDTGVDIAVSNGGANAASVNYYTLTLSAGAGTSSPTGGGIYLAGKSIAINVTVNSGYSWSKWTSNNSGLLSDQYTKSTNITMPTGAVTLTATSTLNTYTINYTLNGGTATNPASYQYTTGEFTLNNPTREGYSFVGWSGTGLTGSANQTVTIAANSTGNKSYTANWKADKPASAPDVSIVTAKTDTSLTITTQDKYEYSVDNGVNWYSGAGSYTFNGLTPGITYDLVCRKAAESTGDISAASDASPALSVTTKEASASVSVPDAPTIGTGANKPTSGSITVSTAAGCEYYISTSATAPVTWPTSGSDYFKATGTDVHTFTGLTAGTQYYIHVRVAETDDAMPSASVCVTQYTLPATPTISAVTINYAAETISFTDTYEVSASADFSTAISSGGTITPGTTYYVRVKSAGGVPASEAASFISAGRPATPDAITAANITRTDVTITILSTVSTQEYSVDGGMTWQTGNNGSLTFSTLFADHAYSVVTRIPSEAAAFASSSTAALSVTTKEASASVSVPDAPTIDTGANKPTSGSITVSTAAGCEYYISTSNSAPATWPTSGSDYFKATGTDGHTFTGLTAGTQYYIYVRAAETDDAMPSASVCVTQYTLPATPAISAVTINYAAETISFENTYEVSASADFSTAISSGGTITPGTTYYVRVKSAGGVPASEAASFTVAAKPDAPSTAAYSYDYHDEQIIFSGSYEVYTANDGSGSAVTSDSTAITPGGTLYIRVKATSSAPASGWTTITIPERPATTGLSLTANRTDETITVAAITGAEYNKDGGIWQSSNEFTGLAPNSDYAINIRYAATASNFASLPLGSVTLTTKTAPGAAPGAPSFSAQTYDSITIVTTAGYQYAITTSNTAPTTWEAAETSGGTKIFSGLSAATQYYIWVRAAETDTAMPSNSGSKSVYTPAATPSAGEGYTIDFSAETISITSGYEVSANDDFGTTLPNGASVTPGATYYVRNAENTATIPTTPASAAVSFTVPSRPDTPAATGHDETVYGKDDGKISGVTTAMEWRAAGGTYAAVTADQASKGITGLSDGTYYVRYKAVSGTGFKSAEQEITLAAGHTITVTFNPQSGSDVAAITGKAFGDSAAAPADPTRSGYYFAGWYREAACTSAWTFTLDVLTDNITLFAKWSAIPTYTVTGRIVDDTSHVVEGATVKIMRGATQYGTTGVTDTNGDFAIDNVPPGTYNLVITKATKTAIIKVEVSNGNVAIGNATLPAGNANSVLVVNGSDTPNVVVGGLDSEARAQLKPGDPDVEIKLTVEGKDASTAANGSEVTGAVTSAGKQVGMILGIDVSKTVNGTEDTSYNQTSEVLEIIIPLPAELQGKATYAVYRYHGTGVDVITEADTDGEKIVIDRTNWTITLYAKKFSTYAIGYTNPASGGGGDIITSYTISASAGEGGSISPSGKVSVTGGSKTFIITANEGYDITDIKVDGVSVGAVSSYTFSNVGANHTIEAVFERKENAVLPYYIENGKEIYIGFASDASGTMTYIAPEGATVLFRENPKSFTDIAGHWAKDNIDFVTERELFLGTGGGHFSPQSGMTRAMFATVIGRLYERSYGKILQKDEHAFADVDYDAYYGAYIDWASENNILTGIGGGLFKPDQEITRQEMAAILYRFAKFLNVSPSESDKTKPNFPDAADIASWAAEAASYCQQTGIITGRSGGYFVPQGTVTRAEVAAILQRFIESSVKQLNDN